MTNFLFFIFIFLISCKTIDKDRLNLVNYSFKQLENWEKDDHAQALMSFINSCDRFTPYYKQKKISNLYNAGKAFDWQKLCSIAKDTDTINSRKFFEDNFKLFLVKNNDKEYGLFTGYHEPYIRGSFTQSERYKYPIYKMPENIDDIRHYLKRNNINDGFLEGRNLELLYTDDDVELFFLHIQGSGRVILDNGEIIRIGYKAQNGHKYFAIGRHLADSLEIDKKLINADFIKEYLRSSNQKKEIMELNPSYIFFDIKDDIYGAFGSSLTTERSLAVDKKYVAYGLPIWLETNYPKIDKEDAKPFNKLLIAQDTGGAIKGVIRGDIFFGSNELAARYASNMKGKGRYFILLPKLH